MRYFGRLGAALIATAFATAAPAAVDSRPAPTPQPRLDTPVEPDGRLAPPPGGWTRDGWSDEARPPRGARPIDVGPRADGSRPDGPRPDDRMARFDDGPRRGDWRRQTWDGGRGEAFRYRRGARLPRTFVSPRYVVSDWRGYGLVPPGPGRDWVRYYDDAVLVDRSGVVFDAVPGIGWDDVDGPAFAYDRRGYDYRGPDRRWHDDGMAWGQWGAQHDGSAYYGPGGVTVITTTTPSIRTTTTTVTESYVAAPRKTWKRPMRAKRLRYTK